MKRIFMITMTVAVVFLIQGCVVSDWLGGKQATVMIAPFLSQYEASKEDLDFLKIELTALTEKMTEKDRVSVEKSYNTIESLIETVKLKQRNGTLTLAEADVIWFMMTTHYDNMITLFDYYQPQMSPSVRIVYNSTKRSAAAAAAEFEALLKLAQGGDIDIDDIDGLLAQAGSALLPIILSAL